MLSLLSALSLLLLRVADPVVYWHASPVLGGESVLLAGAGLADASVRLCDSAAACLAAGGGERVEATSWQHSARFTVPARCVRSPCWARLCGATNASACAAPVGAFALTYP